MFDIQCPSPICSFVVVSLLNTRYHTPVSKRTPNPEYKDAIFDFALYLSLADRLGTLEIVVWDKDNVLRKEYLGEVALPLEDWFREECGFGFYDERNKVLQPVFFHLFLPCSRSQPLSVALVSSRATTHPSGFVQLKLGFVSPPLQPGSGAPMPFEQVFALFSKLSRPSLVSAPPVSARLTLCVPACDVTTYYPLYVL